MDKTGLVIKVERNTAILLSSTGEFVKVNYSKNPPKVGETYTGTIKKEFNYIKYMSTAIILFIIIMCSGGAYAYSIPVATVQVNINPSLELKVNGFNRIIKTSPKNIDGEKLLKNLKLENKNIDDALILVVDEAKKDNFINTSYISEGKTISVKISAKNTNKTINITGFEEYISRIKINTSINNNGKQINKNFTNNYENKDKKALEINKNNQDNNVKDKTNVNVKSENNGNNDSKNTNNNVDKGNTPESRKVNNNVNNTNNRKSETKRIGNDPSKNSSKNKAADGLEKIKGKGGKNK